MTGTPTASRSVTVPAQAGTTIHGLVQLALPPFDLTVAERGAANRREGWRQLPGLTSLPGDAPAEIALGDAGS